MGKSAPIICKHSKDATYNKICVTGANDVNQPNVLWGEIGKSTTINCSHTKGVDYNQMYWYRQHQGETLKLIVFTATYITKPEFGNEFNESKFLASKMVPESGSLTVKNLDFTDSTMYFCATSQREGERQLPCLSQRGTLLTILCL
uniref:Ig-like domain-containing protein n=1 Tax=Electrophorus electricus TaxID=8005 RepID=A0A4W4EHK1_ELEEL